MVVNSYTDYIHDAREGNGLPHETALLMAQEEVKRGTSSDESKQDIFDFIYNDMDVNYIPKDTPLYLALMEHYGAQNKDLSKHIRYFAEDEENIYFAHGANYSWIDADLLGGDGDGRAEKAFSENWRDFQDGIKSAAQRSFAVDPIERNKKLSDAGLAEHERIQKLGRNDKR